jgi:hypothetical protein
MQPNLKRFNVGCISISTGHIPKHTADLLGNEGRVPADTTLWDAISYTFWHDYGWIIWCCHDHAEAAREAGHPELADLIKMCADKDICFLQLDGDAEVVGGLPTFDW